MLKKKILWLSNHKVSFDTSEEAELKRNSGRGWVAALEMVLRDFKEYEIAIAYPDNSISGITKNAKANRIFYQIPAPNGKYQRWLLRFIGKPEGYQYIENCLKVIRDFNPDLIHVYGTENGFGEIVHHTRIPVVIDLQGILSMIVKRWFSFISKPEVILHSGLFPLINLKSHYHDYKVKVRRSERERTILKKAQFVMGRTQWDQMISKIMAPGAIYLSCERVIREAFWKVDWQWPGRQRIELISVMNEDFYKGLDVIFLAAMLLNEAGIIFTWKIAGLTQKDSYVRIVSRKLRLTPTNLNIQFLGKIDSSALAGLLSHANFFINSSYIENSPNSVCEAMVAGTPVIATCVGGVPSLVVHNHTGWVIQEGDYTMLAGLIASLADSPEITTSVAAKGKGIARKRHDPDRIAEKLIGNYNLVLGRTSQKTAHEPVYRTSDI